jgi:hypothetical protein
MPHHPRIETKDYAAFTTTRTKHSELWFINNKKFEEKILAFFVIFRPQIKRMERISYSFPLIELSPLQTSPTHQ